MSDTVICVENLSKKYIIGQQKQESYTALRDVIANGAKSIGSKLLKPFDKQIPQQTTEDFWALKDVSFEIKQGDRVGIIGRNGAGKSTLLKILSRITEPTKGQISIKGRVASLLEVGTGFHAELTGRENIYLNGAILGMSKAEIKRKFDEIVAFADVEKFLDTPVKRYSSGMYVRLAFAVAAHLEPEILIVDEVLAVGDVQFQEKCLGKMEDVAKQGRTVFFVSHNTGAVRALCTRGIFLKEGRILVDDSIDQAIRYYMGHKIAGASSYAALKKQDYPYFIKVELYQSNTSANSFSINKPISIKFDLETYGKKGLVVGIVIRNAQGIWVHHSSDEFNSGTFNDRASHRECEIPPHALAPGKYYLDIFLGQRNFQLFEKLTDVLAFEVDFDGTMSDRTMGADWKGACGPGILSWR
jgi:lipopolysaccharide transport system ATP-binding protein